MGTTADKLARLNETKALLKTRLTEKGLDVASENNFYNLANKVGEISGDDRPEYNIYNVSIFHFQPEKAKAGDIVILSAGQTVTATSIYLESYIGRKIVGKVLFYENFNDIPEVFRQYFENIPSVVAPPVGKEMYAFFVMPPCDVFVVSA